MDITYIHHDGFAIETDELIMIIDYFESSPEDKEILNNVLAWKKLHHESKGSKDIYFLSSHSHHDHFTKNILDYAKEYKNIKYIFSGDIEHLCSDYKKNDITYIDKGDVYEDSAIYIKAYGSTDIGVSFSIRIKTQNEFVELTTEETLKEDELQLENPSEEIQVIEDVTIFHAGDLNNWHWNEECDFEESSENEIEYLRELKEIALENDFFDIVMFPIDPRLGKDYMKGAEQFLHFMKAGNFFPMHFWENYEKGNQFEVVAFDKCTFLPIEFKGQKFTMLI